MGRYFDGDGILLDEVQGFLEANGADQVVHLVDSYIGCRSGQFVFTGRVQGRAHPALSPRSCLLYHLV